METATSRPNLRWLLPLLLGVVLVAGIWLRWPLASDAEIKGFDEGIYVQYVTVLHKYGLNFFPDLCAEYLRVQPERQAFLPPTRVLFLTASTLWTNATGMSVLESIRAVSSVSACLTLILGAVWAWRLGGPTAALGVSALLACAPTQIQMAHRALIDGFFGFWALLALWSMWEALQAPGRRSWLYLYGVALAAMVLTKENAAFVLVALCGLLALNRWARFGNATRALYATTLVGPAVGGLLLLILAGNPITLISVYRLNVEKSLVLPYAHLTGDGPWFRYFVDLLLVSPAVLLVAIAAFGNWSRRDTSKLYFVVFFALTCALMSRVRYGMNLRYGNMWDLPLRWIVCTQLGVWVTFATERYRGLLLAFAVAVLCTLDLAQYNRLFVDHRIYDPTVAEMATVLDLVKSPVQQKAVSRSNVVTHESTPVSSATP